MGSVANYHLLTGEDKIRADIQLGKIVEEAISPDFEPPTKKEKKK